MPVYVVQRGEPQEEIFRELSSKIFEKIDACKEVEGAGKKKLKQFLLETGIRSIAEMDYPLRKAYEEFLKSNQLIKRTERYLLAFDRVKQYSIWEQMQTLAGRQQCRWQLENRILFIPYHSDQAIAMEFDSVRNKSNMVWDFERSVSQTVKEQVFTTLNAVIERFRAPRLREQRLSGLKLLYDFCSEKGIEDIEKLDATEVQKFEAYLDKHTISGSRKKQMLPILNFCRKTTFLQSEEIHWKANIWYLERLHLPKNRVNPSGSYSSISFLEITIPENRRYAQEYMKYQIGITGQSVSTMVTKYEGIRIFLIRLCERNREVCGCTAEQIDSYLKELEERNIISKTFNEYLTGLSQFFRFLVVRGYMKQIPFRVEYYQKKVLPKHHDRSVSQEVSTEMLAKLHLLPEHLRCMYLHLWTLGLRISEVCTLKGNAYYRQEQDAWIQIYQIKMKNYKRIPIADGLYKIMQVYIKKHNIGPDDYLFMNQNGRPYRSATFRKQMKKFCTDNEVKGGEYLFQSHDYRHTVATFFYDSGVSLQSVRDYLGHNYEEMTQQYVDYVPRKIAKANDEFFKNPGNRLTDCLKKG